MAQAHRLSIDRVLWDVNVSPFCSARSFRGWKWWAFMGIGMIFRIMYDDDDLWGVHNGINKTMNCWILWISFFFFFWDSNISDGIWVFFWLNKYQFGCSGHDPKFRAADDVNPLVGMETSWLKSKGLTWIKLSILVDTKSPPQIPWLFPMLIWYFPL